VVFVFIFLLFTACGIEEFYYLPQVPQESISVQFNSNADIDIPAISSVNFYYASGYQIFYRIYLSDELLDTINENNFSRINPSLLNDFNFFSSYTDLTNNTIVMTSSIFSSRNYFEMDYAVEIDFAMNRNGGNLSLNFLPEDGIYPVADFNGDTRILRRSRDVIRDSQTNIIEPNNFFWNTAELRNNLNAVSVYNADTAPIQNRTPVWAYTAMYIVTTGQNPQTFARIYSKPTFIGVFKLPDAN